MTQEEAQSLATWIRDHVPHWTVDACGVLVNGHGPELVCTNTRTGRQFLIKDERGVNAALAAEQKGGDRFGHKVRAGRNASTVLTLAVSAGLKALERGEDLARVAQRLTDDELTLQLKSMARGGATPHETAILRDEMHRRGFSTHRKVASRHRKSTPKQRSLF